MSAVDVTHTASSFECPGQLGLELDTGRSEARGVHVGDVVGGDALAFGDAVERHLDGGERV
jgi:hypothetical protein